MSATSPSNARPGPGAPTVRHTGRDSFWADRHQVARQVSPLTARKKWQCLACGECGFVELIQGEDRPGVIARIAHGCQPESITFYSAGAHRPLRE